MLRRWHKIIVVIHIARQIFANLIQSDSNLLRLFCLFSFHRVLLASSYREFKSDEQLILSFNSRNNKDIKDKKARINLPITLCDANPGRARFFVCA